MRKAQRADFAGKTIKTISMSACNVWKITFEDGSKIEIWAELFGNPSLPELLVEVPGEKIATAAE